MYSGTIKKKKEWMDKNTRHKPRKQSDVVIELARLTRTPPGGLTQSQSRRFGGSAQVGDQQRQTRYRQVNHTIANVRIP